MARIADGVGGVSRLAILERCGQVPHRERAEEVLRRVAEFVDSL